MKEEITFTNFRKEHGLELVRSWRKSFAQAIRIEEDSREEVVNEHLAYLLTVNQESETCQLIEYLGLDWDEKCLSSQNNTRSVATASNVQVREKVYRGGSEQRRKYQSFLNGALDGLLSP